jgi:ATP-dependent Clp protease ATP-binding subunit ClpB
VLFDELEKAHPDVFNILLQVMDDGRLTDGQGRVVDFRNTVLIMTSNVGSSRLAEQLTETDAELRKQLQLDLRENFRPEFLNRIDAIVPFHRLGMAQLQGIVEIQLGELKARLAARKVELSLSPAALKHLAERGFDPAYGARPLRRVIQDELADPLAMRLVSGDLREGEKVEVDLKDGALKIG